MAHPRAAITAGRQLWHMVGHELIRGQRPAFGEVRSDAAHDRLRDRHQEMGRVAVGLSPVPLENHPAVVHDDDAIGVGRIEHGVDSRYRPVAAEGREVPERLRGGREGRDVAATP